ncbi:MAG TPA: DUF4438 domain-containing protein [Bacillota bacterium]|jgi:hypothetical protein
MIRTNKDRLVMISVMGGVSAPSFRHPYSVGHDGVGRVLPGVGGVTYNVRVGDPAFGWAADHVEPGVSSKDKDEAVNGGYNTLSCVGNKATVVTGEAKGAIGTVTGKHGGIEHVIIDFPQEALEKLAVGDRIQVRGYGQGLELPDFPRIKLLNLDPGLFETMGAEAVAGKLRLPVVGIVPPELMGSGIGSTPTERGDYDITAHDHAALVEAGLDQLRLGDIVAIRDHSTAYGRDYQRGAMSVGVVIHTDSFVSGHGPGVTALMTSTEGSLEPVVASRANIADYLDLRRQEARP